MTLQEEALYTHFAVSEGSYLTKKR